jgi:hypothetical protein
VPKRKKDIKIVIFWLLAVASLSFFFSYPARTKNGIFPERQARGDGAGQAAGMYRRGSHSPGGPGKSCYLSALLEACGGEYTRHA